MDNKLGITNQSDLAREEKITKLKALELFDSKKINDFEVGTFKDFLKFIDTYLKMFIHLLAKLEKLILLKVTLDLLQYYI